MLETRVASTMGEDATRKAINISQVSRMLRLTLLTPDSVKAILDGRQAPELTLPVLMGPFPVEWKGQ